MNNVRTSIEELSQKIESSSIESRWLNLKQAAQYLGTTVRAVEAYVLKGKLPCYKPFGRIIFDRFELDKIVATSRK